MNYWTKEKKRMHKVSSNFSESDSIDMKLLCQNTIETSVHLFAILFVPCCGSVTVLEPVTYGPWFGFECSIPEVGKVFE